MAGFAGLDVEHRVMPRAVQPIPSDNTIGQRCAVVGAMGADGENVSAAAYQQNRLAAGVPGDHRAVGKFAFSNALAKIGTFRLGPMPHEVATESLSRFMREVAPQFRR